MTGKVRLRIRGACPEDCLHRMALRGIRFRDMKKVDVLTAEFTVGFSDLKHAEECAKRTMCEAEIIKIYGFVPALKAMGPRIGYFVLLISIVFSVFWLQGHIFFLEIEGSTTIPEGEIRQILEENGIGFWTSCEDLDMNALKNEILAEIPELGWITVNNEGPIATVVVRQREEKPAAFEKSGPANILAAKNGIIEDVTVTGGSALVKEGDVVTVGQLLISGVTNLDKTLLLTQAEGEVTARTFQRFNAVSDDSFHEKAYTGRETTKFSITFGKNTINFYKTSGISYDNYDKMTVRNTLTLPGDYSLPVCITATTFREYELVETPLEEQRAEALLRDAVRRNTESGLLAGSILNLGLRLTNDDGAYFGHGIVECREEIGMSVEIKD